MPQHHSYRWLGFLAQQLKKCGHEFAHSLFAGRRVHRAANVNRAVAITGKVYSLQYARRNTWAKQLAIPCPMIAVGNGSGVFAAQNPFDALPDALECLPVATSGQRVALILIVP